MEILYLVLKASEDAKNYPGSEGGGVSEILRIPRSSSRMLTRTFPIDRKVKELA